MKKEYIDGDRLNGLEYDFSAIKKEFCVKNFDRLRIRLIFVVKITNRLLTHKYISV